MCPASPEASVRVSRSASAGWMDNMSPQQQQDGGQQVSKRVRASSVSLWAFYCHLDLNPSARTHERTQSPSPDCDMTLMVDGLLFLHVADTFDGLFREDMNECIMNVR